MQRRVLHTKEYSPFKSTKLFTEEYNITLYRRLYTKEYSTPFSPPTTVSGKQETNETDSTTQVNFLFSNF